MLKGQPMKPRDCLFTAYKNVQRAVRRDARARPSDRDAAEVPGEEKGRNKRRIRRKHQ